MDFGGIEATLAADPGVALVPLPDAYEQYTHLIACYFMLAKKCSSGICT